MDDQVKPISEDIEAFVTKVDAGKAWHTSEADVCRLLAIIRAQGAELAKNRFERTKDLSEMAQLANALDGVRSVILAPSLPDEEVPRVIGQVVDERNSLHVAICDAVGAPYTKQFDLKEALDRLRKERDALRDRLAKLENEPDGENLYDGCLCGEIAPSDKPCLTCEARLHQWDSVVAERDDLRLRLANLRATARPVLDALQVHVLPRMKSVDLLVAALGAESGTTETK